MSLLPHHRPLDETWQTELEWDTGRSGLGLKVCPKFSLLLRFNHFILEKIPPPIQIARTSHVGLVHAISCCTTLPNSRNEPFSACFCCLAAPRPHLNSNMSHVGSFCLLVAARHRPRSKNVSMLVHFCCLPTVRPAEMYPCR